MIALGFFTRPNAIMLTGTLTVAILQNLARRDPQLAILYMLAMVSFIFLGGGTFSIDAAVVRSLRQEFDYTTFLNAD